MLRILPLSMLLGLVHAMAAGADLLWVDDFSAPRSYERWGTRAWTLADGQMGFRGTQAGARLLARLEDPVEGTVRAALTVGRRLGGSYEFAGLTLFADEGNHWQLLLVESPDGTRYCELIEKLEGVHQAQLGVASPATALPTEQSGDLTTWEYGTPYVLELRWSPESIVGTVTDPRNGTLWRRTYGLRAGRAVTSGRPGLATNGLAGTFDDLSVEGTPPADTTAWALAPGPSGTAVVVADETGALAAQWRQVLTAEGFGALAVSWDELLQGPLPVSRIDLLVLADARRLPIPARDAVKCALRFSGKVIALGAPAFSEVLAHTPQGWVGPDTYGEAIISRLSPVPLSPGSAWQRGARYPDKQSTIEPDPQEGASAWKLTFDYDGWDGFATNIEGAFGAERTLLTFRARGDAETAQLLIECTEIDGSRWIGAVPLSTEWRACAIRPQDLPYWRDSTAKDRGGPGDAFRPANARAVVFGLAQSHTPKVQPGRHTIWIKDLGTASSTGSEPDFLLPEIQALSPSYMLFPVPAPVRVRAALEQAILPGDQSFTYRAEAYSPVWRERGRGFDRDRSWRWIPLLEARDKDGTHRGALLSLMLGDSAHPDAMWANLCVADPADALKEPKLRQAVLAAAKAMARGCFLLEGGARVFSCEPGEQVVFGAEVLNAGRAAQELTVALQGPVQGGISVPLRADRTARVRLGPGERTTQQWTLSAPAEGRHTIEVRLLLGDQVIDRIAHELVVEKRREPSAEDFVRVEGDRFVLHGKPWTFKGINYRPNFVGGYPHLNMWSRECYDPEIIERDLAWMESIGLNAISAVHALVPPDPEAPDAYRDQIDFLDRCERHGIKVFFFLPNARPFAGADAAWVMRYLDQAGIKDHPAVMCWELAWEPIHGTWENGLDIFLEPWNRWLVQRYGSADNALADWGYRPALTADGKVPVPTSEMATTHGPWDPMTSAFRRAFSDLLSQGYREIVTPLRAYDPRHLISFRFGACGIPNAHVFAHSHSVGALKHVDFMNPEGYSLMSGWTTATPADDWRKGGLVTLYYRHFSREKPVVWMEFGHTVNSINDSWAQPRLHIDPAQLEAQKADYEALYAMFIESGARGAAPWWMPGGFRLGENSDFGVLEPDGTERPVCEVIRRYLPQFDAVRHDPPTGHLDLDLNAHVQDAWNVYAPEYLRRVKAGERLAVRTAGTGTDSATCPLTAVGNRPYNGHNPPIHLNAEFNALEIRSGDGPWGSVNDGETVEVKAGQPVRCRASVGNLGEARWLAAERIGGVYLAGRSEYGLEFAAPIGADTEFLRDAAVPEFTLLPAAAGETVVSFEMQARDRAWFGERRTVTLKAAP